MKQWKRLLALLFALMLLLTACAEREKKLSFSFAVDPGDYRPGDTVGITVYAENVGRKFSYVGADIDQFSSPMLILKTEDSEYSISNKWNITTTDATKRQFQSGETASRTFRLDIPADAVPGKYTLICWVFGQKAEFADAVTILPADAAPGPAVDDPDQLTAEIENAWYVATGATLGDWCVDGEDGFVDGVRYYGSVDGYHILFRPTNDDAITKLEVLNVTFSHNTGFELYAYRDGDFTPLQELSQEGALSQVQVKELSLMHLAYEGRLARPDGPSISVDAMELMKLAFLQKFAADTKYTTADLSVVYYGDYRGAHVGFINGIMLYTQALTSETVAGITFRYNTGQKLQVYFEGELMGLSEAYDRGALSVEDLVVIRNILNPQQDNSVTE